MSNILLSRIVSEKLFLKAVTVLLLNGRIRLGLKLQNTENERRNLQWLFVRNVEVN